MPLDAISATLGHPIVQFLIYAWAGWILHWHYTSWRHGDRQNQIELVNNSIAHQIVANKAIEKLDREERQELEEEINEQAEESFVNHLSFQIAPDDKEKY